MNSFLFRFREPLSATGAVTVVFLLLNSWTPPVTSSANHTAPMTVTFSEPEKALPPPAKRLTIKHKVTHDPAPKLTGKKPAAFTPVTPAPSSSPAAPTVYASQTPSLPALPTALRTLPMQNSSRNTEAIYAERVRTALRSAKHYPTGREASLQRPSGTSTVWFIVNRNGDLADAGIANSSGFMLLDNAALSTVRRGTYPAFPNDAWPDKTQQRFSVELNFSPAY